jgi:hypothetical protein
MCKPWKHQGTKKSLAAQPWQERKARLAEKEQVDEARDRP